mmetsp:Transcript_9867/g.39949  ORF Transcript_9867/g.39949 Transcript_9867/m.39949 type:complete len:566 (-) Transcript_9867:20-1717(-)
MSPAYSKNTATLCETSLLFRRKASAASLAVEAESPAWRDGAVANVAAAFDNASTAPITRVQPMPAEARTVKMAPLLAGRRTAALKFSKNDSPKSSRRRMTPPVASARGANFSAPTASLPPTSMSTDTPSLAIVMDSSSTYSFAAFSSKSKSSESSSAATPPGPRVAGPLEHTTTLPPPPPPPPPVLPCISSATAVSSAGPRHLGRLLTLRLPPLAGRSEETTASTASAHSLSGATYVRPWGPTRSSTSSGVGDLLPGSTSAAATPVVTERSYAATAAAYVKKPTRVEGSAPRTHRSSDRRNKAHSSSSIDSSTTNTTAGVEAAPAPEALPRGLTSPPVPTAAAAASVRYSTSTRVSSGKPAAAPGAPTANIASELSQPQKQHLHMPLAVSTAQNGDTNAAHRAHLAGSLRSAGSSAGAPTATGAKGDTSAPSGRLPALASVLVLGNAEHVAATRVSTPCAALDASSDIDSPSSDGGAKCDDVDATGLMNPPADRDGVELGLEDQALTGAPPAPTWVGNTSSRAISPVPGAGPKLQPPDRHRSAAELSSYLTASPHASRTMKPLAK